MDVMKLLMSDFRAALVNDNLRELHVCLEGPQNTLYEGGLWKVHVELPEQYPYKSPSIGFDTKIYHPNIDEHSGSVCLDVINQTWSPMFTITHIFETFLPQLLDYPNASDPLNGDASALYLNNRDKYEEKVKTYVAKYANPRDVSRAFNLEHGLPDEDRFDNKFNANDVNGQVDSRTTSRRTDMDDNDDNDDNDDDDEDVEDLSSLDEDSADSDLDMDL